jgi:ADP-L-glycero-D-manno-heptose 6-epimerase
LNPYGHSKLEFDIWAYQESLELKPPRWAGLRFFNVYGPGEEHKGGQASVVVHAREQILKNKTLKLFKSHRDGIADGQQKRDFVFVEDVCSVCSFFIFDKPITSGIFNVGTGQARTFLDLGKACFHALGVKDNIEFIPTPEKLRSHYQYFTQSDLTRLRSSGYTQSFTSLEDGVAKTFQNYHG